MSTSHTDFIIKQLSDQLFKQLVFFHTKLLDYPQTEEIVQGIFVKVWQNLDTIEHIDDKKSYLL